jgi:beta-glucanase (GH16 family)
MSGFINNPSALSVNIPGLLFHHKKYFMRIAIFLLVLLITASCGHTKKITDTGKWKLIWNDEFNYKGLPDSTKWSYDTGGHGWGNNEKQYYLERSVNNSFVRDGLLHIVALKRDFENLKYTSAKLTTYKKIGLQYGKIEVMARLPRGKGSWPAIWMLPESIRTGSEQWPFCGEIDIMEHVGRDPNVIHTSLHSGLYNHVKGTQITHFDTMQNVFDDFHKYGIEWSEASIRFLIDDKLFFESFKGQGGRVTTNDGWPFDKPYYLILNLAIGGNWGGEIDDTIFPNTLLIDYVRIYSRKDPSPSN